MSDELATHPVPILPQHPSDSPAIQSWRKTCTAMADVTATVIAAWYGAAVATAVFLWDIYKWGRRGPRIRLTVNTRMRIVGADPLIDSETEYVTITAVNIGDQATTLTNAVGYHYRSRLSRILRRSDKTFVVVTGGAFGPPLPHRLDAGERWIGGANQEKVKESCGDSGLLYCGVIIATAQRPILLRVRL